MSMQSFGSVAGVAGVAGKVDSVLDRMRSKAQKKKERVTLPEATEEEAEEVADVPLEGAQSSGSVAGQSSGELQPWEKKPKKSRGPPLTGDRVEITPVTSMSLAAAAGVAPKVDKVTQMLKAKAARKKKQQVPAPARVD